ncbi:hypothetical protein ACQP1P_28780 [Dactylosporangium sp. CA-052675]|uniref:hypothetical protein n=1 Tax=Dactylosporangium sp. CA-052675 TaxID=3239927 RepID=UPI003D8ED56C
MRSVVVLAVAVLVLAACARPAAAPALPPSPSPPVTHPAWVACPPGDDDPTAPLGLPPLPAGFVPAGVVICADGLRTRADGGEDRVRRERRGSDVAALVAALRLPSEPRTAEACDLSLVGVVWFAVLDAAGRWLRPGVAADACGKPRIEVRDALDRLTLTTVRTTVLGETKSAAAAASGCEQRWGEMIGAVTAGSAGSAGSAAPAGGADAPKGPVRLCVYTVPASEQGSGKPAGDFARGGLLPADRWTVLRAKLLAAGPPVPCPAHAGRFAVLRAPDGAGGEVYAELDGCHRLLFSTPSGNALRQGSAALAAEIDRP